MFKDFGKIYRLNRELIVTEKIDGTNAAVLIGDDGKFVHAQSRNRIITPENDNAGFARWAEENKAKLELLGPGYHYGEWWGKGIQCGYGLDHKRFSLFNVGRWTDSNEEGKIQVPEGIYVVPIIGIVQPLGVGLTVKCCLMLLESFGSRAAPGFMKPEGIVIFHTQSGYLFKWTIENDQEGKNSALRPSNPQDIKQGSVPTVQ